MHSTLATEGDRVPAFPNGNRAGTGGVDVLNHGVGQSEDNTEQMMQKKKKIA
jgi:hypothetical protein